MKTKVNCNFLSKKYQIFFFSCNFSQFLVIKILDEDPDIQPKMLDPDPESKNPYPKHWAENES